MSIVSYYNIISLITEPNQVVYSVTDKITYCQDDFLICRYDLSFVWREEFIVQFRITERDESSQMTNMINPSKTAMIQYDTSETRQRIKQQITAFKSKRGLFWHVNVIILSCSDGSFCIFDKNNSNINLTSITPDRQTLKKFNTIFKNYSFIESKPERHFFWLFPEIKQQMSISIDCTVGWISAYSSPPSHNFITNSELITLADISCSLQSKKNIPAHIKIDK
ncbi:MAG: hypothetical protein LBE13_14510 [Bacteroidales bacterium]|jgi:hypothetical protein|nr:hypothetical protein [Bacteroidales bacterium]